MQIGRIENATRVIGKSQGYIGLPLHDEIVNCKVNGEGTPSMVTSWFPSVEEIEAICSGAPIHVRLIGTQHPTIMVSVGKRPD